MSEREWQCFVLHVGFDFSFRQIASELNIQTRTVRTHIDRAKLKIERNKINGLYPLEVHPLE
ncbi:sigma factor-like helix-turn-helix DNA-binding protein [Paenibacillus sp. y28]|uniref:sigma factor-like helix-turn-helix DNA-binding protein n=1 Tax=Paenibacillus sp. y28 TaxID=3129110 RepID=UPI003FA6A547